MADQGYTKVDFGLVTGLAEGINSQANAIDGMLDDLKGQISSLDQLWEGSASEGYKQTKQAWFTAADDLKAVLSRIGAAVHAASESYSATEAGNAKMWG
jgi:WXG100 family type VII secretion target